MNIWKDFKIILEENYIVLFSFRNLAHNKFIGPLPDLTGMDTLNYV